MEKTKDILTETRDNWKIGYAKMLIELGISDEFKSAIEKEFTERAESEDERIRKGLIAFVDKYYGEETKKPVLAWLEKHKEQQSAEWSEEDDAFRDLLICILKTEHPNGIFSMSAKHVSALKCDVMPVGRIVNWLKSLRPQPHWKPSEEQMEALLSKLPVIKGGGDKVQDILESLYDDLKKL